MFEYQKYIYEVYLTKSFSKAAKKLFISQPALSTAIRKAEEKLDFKIFDRHTNPITLTEEGTIYIDYLLKVRETELSMKERLLELSDLQSGYINVGGTNFFASYMLPFIIQNFSKQYPKIHLQITEEDSLHLYQTHTDNNIDIIIDSGNYDEELYYAIPLIKEHVIIGIHRSNPVNDQLKEYQLTSEDILAGKHLLPETPCPCLQYFENEKFLLLSKNHDLHIRSMAICKEQNITPTDYMYLNQLMTAYNFAQHGIGLAFLTDTVVYLSKRKDELVYYRLDSPEAERTCFLAFSNVHIKTKAMEKFIEIAKDTINDQIRNLQ